MCKNDNYGLKLNSVRLLSLFSIHTILHIYKLTVNTLMVDKYTKVETLGEGTYGIVTLVELDSKLYSLKKFKKPIKLSCCLNTLKNTGSVVEIIYSNEHAGDTVSDSNKITDGDSGKVLAIVTKYIFGQCLIDVFSTMTAETYFTFDELEQILFDLLQQVNAWHSADIIHSDIKPDNVIYDRQTGTCCLIDLDSCVSIIDQNTIKTGITKSYLSPEFINTCGTAKMTFNVLKRNNVYAIGMTVYCMAKGEAAFEQTCEEYPLREFDFNTYCSLKFSCNHGITVSKFGHTYDDFDRVIEGMILSPKSTSSVLQSYFQPYFQLH